MAHENDELGAAGATPAVGREQCGIGVGEMTLEGLRSIFLAPRYRRAASASARLTIGVPT